MPQGAKGLELPDWRGRLLQGTLAAALLKAELKKWGDVIRRIGLQAE